jgi:hypothetical protein
MDLKQKQPFLLLKKMVVSASNLTLDFFITKIQLTLI